MRAMHVLIQLLYDRGITNVNIDNAMIILTVYFVSWTEYLSKYIKV